MTTSRARPQALRDYVTATTSARDAAYEARGAISDAYDQLVAALPSGFAAPDRPDVAGPLGRCRDVDEHCSTVAEWFERAGASGDALATVAGVPAYTNRYSGERRDRLRRRAERELAQLRENIAAGNRGETTGGELMATLGWMEFAIARSDDPYATAAELIDTMGPGDLHEALALLEAHARDVDDLSGDSWPVRGMHDLMYVVSMGLESQPDRAADWAEDVADLRDIPVEPVGGALASVVSASADGLALLGAYVPDGTSTLGAALFDVVFTVGPLPDDGLTARLHDTTSPLEPILRSATENPALANDIVTGVLETTDPHHPDFVDRLMAGEPPPTRFDSLFGQTAVFGDLHAPAERFAAIPQSLLGDVITSSVHPTLADTTRIDTAAALTEHYVDSPESITYSQGVTRGLASATQPLLEVWNAAEGSPTGLLVLDGQSADRASEINDALWEALGEYGESEGGVQGIASALSGATTGRLAAASQAGIASPDLAEATYPFDTGALHDLNRLYSTTASAMAGARFDAVVTALEAGGDVDWARVHGTAAKDVLVGLVGEVPGGSTVGGLIDAGWTYGEAVSADDGQEVLDGTSNPFYTIEATVNAELIGMTLDARPDLRAALYDQLEQTARDGGLPALSEAVLDPPSGNPELIELRNLVADQRREIDLHDAQDILRAANPDRHADAEG